MTALIYLKAFSILYVHLVKSDTLLFSYGIDLLLIHVLICMYICFYVHKLHVVCDLPAVFPHNGCFQLPYDLVLIQKN